MVRGRLALLVGACLLASASSASDLLGDGIEPDPGPPPKVTPGKPLKPISEYPGHEPRADVLPVMPVPADSVLGGVERLTAKDGGPYAVDMEDFTPDGLLSDRARKTYDLLGKIKEQLTQIGGWLEDRGKEKTKLIQTSESMGQNMGELSALWEDELDLRQACITSKRLALVLHEQVTIEPRRWPRIHLVFDEALKEISATRRIAAILADDEPRPYLKDGKLLVPEKTLSPEVAERKRAERSKKIAQQRLEIARKFEETQRQKKKDQLEGYDQLEDKVEKGPMR